VYSVSKNGWFEINTFSTWFEKVFIPHISHLQGRKVIIGDNLGCHFSENVLKSCRDNDVAFVPLIPNSTHLTQPLDVAVFKPLKEVAKRVINEWRLESRINGGIPKQVFPALLKRIFNNLKEENLRSGKKLY